MRGTEGKEKANLNNEGSGEVGFHDELMAARVLHAQLEAKSDWTLLGPRCERQVLRRRRRRREGYKEDGEGKEGYGEGGEVVAVEGSLAVVEEDLLLLGLDLALALGLLLRRK